MSKRYYRKSKKVNVSKPHLNNSDMDFIAGLFTVIGVVALVVMFFPFIVAGAMLICVLGFIFGGIKK